MKKFQQITVLISRILLGAVFIFSGLVKAIDPLGTVYKIEDYLKAFGGLMTELLPLAGAAAVVLIAVEFMLGISLVANLRARKSIWLVLAFMLVMTPLTLWIAIANPVSDCGCFGDAIVLSNWATFWKNIVLLTLTVLVILLRRSILKTMRRRTEYIIALVAFVAVSALMTWTYYHLPIMDFRPYKVGNNIPELMEVPEDAPQDEYRITFIYEKEGQLQEFTLDNYPKGDSTWTFVDQKSKLIKKGYEAPIHDFELLNYEYEDLTYDILESSEPVTLIICYDLDKTDMGQEEKMKALMSRCEEDLEACYIVTGSGEQAIDDFCWEVGVSNTAFLTCDPVTLKTIVRANPGVIVVQNGNIVDKYNLRNR